MRKFIYFIAMATLFISCTSGLTQDELETNNCQSGKFQVKLPDALNNAETIFGKLEDGFTRAPSRKVKSVENLQSKSTRSGSEDASTLFYLVNYADNAGFAMLAADSRLELVYAISNEGSLSLNDTIENKGLADFFETAFSQAEYIIDNSSEDVDPYLVIKNNTIAQVGPLVKEYVAQNLHQGNPFNKYCFTDESEQAVAGCVAIAAEICMTFNKWPESYKDRSFDWNTMFDDSETSLDNHAFLISEIGKAVDMRYGVLSSGAVTAKLQKAMQEFGYKDSGELKSFDDKEVIKHFKNTAQFRGPLVVRGSSQSSGHAWVADGYLKYDLTRNQPKPVGEDPYINAVTLIHCIWGWNGSCNGYFKWNSTLDSFDMNSYNTEYENRHNYKPPYKGMQYFMPFMPNK